MLKIDSIHPLQSVRVAGKSYIMVKQEEEAKDYECLDLTDNADYMCKNPRYTTITAHTFNPDTMKFTPTVSLSAHENSFNIGDNITRKPLCIDCINTFRDKSQEFLESEATPSLPLDFLSTMFKEAKIKES